MKKLLLAALLGAGTLAALPATAEVGVSVTVGEPGFFGRLDIGDYPRPRLIYAEPVMIERVTVVPGPVYLHVPPGHAKDWRKHCKHYNACGAPVYFVDNNWYDTVYVPTHRQRVKMHGGHGHDGGGKSGHGKHGNSGKNHGKGKGNKGHKK